MGFLKQNTNQFKVYLTPKGKELMTNGGILSSISYFSLSDESTNYNVISDSSTFDPTDIDYQDIVTIENSSEATNGLSTIYSLSSLRGDVSNNIEKHNILTDINISQMSDLLIWGNEISGDKSMLTYKDTNGYRSYKLIDDNGLYLRSAYPTSITDYNQLNKNYDFYPTLDREVTLFDFTNCSYTDGYDNKPKAFVGSNGAATTNSSVVKSEIKKKKNLILNERYYTEFNVYFNFYGGQNYVNGSDDYKLNVNFYANLGTNKQQLLLDGLLYYDYTANDGSYTNIPTGMTSYVYISGNTLYLQYTNDSVAKSLFDNFSNALYDNNFKLRCRLLNNITGFTSSTNNITTDNKDFSISIEYSGFSKTNVITNNTGISVSNPSDGNTTPEPISPD
jgi:hypothetical protein